LTDAKLDQEHALEEKMRFRYLAGGALFEVRPKRERHLKLFDAKDFSESAETKLKQS